MASYLNVELNKKGKTSIFLGGIEGSHAKLCIITHLDKEAILKVLEGVAIEHEILGWNLPKVTVNGFVWEVGKVISGKLVPAD